MAVGFKFLHDFNANCFCVRTSETDNRVSLVSLVNLLGRTSMNMVPDLLNPALTS